MRNLILSVIAIFIFSSVAIADNGLVTTKSAYNVSATADRFEKALFWEDENGQTWLSYNDPEYIVTRHDIKGCDEVVKKITHALSNFAKAATGK
jgi:hypothetical protein